MQLRHQRVDRLVQVGIEAGGAPHQEDLGHLEMIAEGVAVGHRTRRDHGRAQQSGHQQDRDDPARHRSPPPGILAAVEDHPTQLAEHPQRRDDAQLHPDGQQDGQADPVEPARARRARGRRGTSGPGPSATTAPRRRAGARAPGRAGRGCGGPPPCRSSPGTPRSPGRSWVSSAALGERLTPRGVSARPRRIAMTAGPGSAGIGPDSASSIAEGAVPPGGVVSVAVVADAGLLVVRRVSTRHAEDLSPDPLGDRRRIVQDDRRGHDHVEGPVGEREILAAAQQQLDPVVAAEVLRACSSCVGLKSSPTMGTSSRRRSSRSSLP